MQSLIDTNLDVDYYEHFINSNEADQLYNLLLTNVKWKTALGHRRTNQTYGDAGLVYAIKFKSATVSRSTLDWSELPELIALRDRISLVTKTQYNICVIQYYPSGKIGINSHRDKEMTHGTIISGVSLGSSRVLRLSNWSQSRNHYLCCQHGSLYNLNPPTNDKWSHAIIKDESILTPRISLTFRNYQ